MSNLLVYATALSRLHADLLVVRLKQADVAMSQISIVHPKASRPNSTRCWLSGSLRLPLASGANVSVAGPLRHLLAHSRRGTGPNTLVSRLRRLGLTPGQSHEIDERLMENRIIVAIAVPSEFELPAIFGALRGVAAEDVRAVDLAPAHGAEATSSRH